MYVRRGSNCQLVDQPSHVNVQDAYGNTFENWCVDFVRTDRFNFPIGITPTPQVAASAIPGDLDPQLFETPIYAWVEKDGVEYYYELPIDQSEPLSLFLLVYFFQLIFFNKLFQLFIKSG